MIKIKICGITNLADAEKAVELGADALGFIFSKSPRRIDAEIATEIIKQLPPFITTVGVFVNESAEVVKHIASVCRLNVLQFHGDELPEYCSQFGRKVIKSFRVKNPDDLSMLPGYKGIVSAYLLDSRVKGKRGGTGETFDWELAKIALPYGRVILAGGLTPENVAEAIQAVNPYAVDVSTGVESSPGKKDFEKMRRFIEAVRKFG
ncbi:MAG: phosphoribosylanthranilate isomerase [bacterium]|nr:phosphoribosylanthranilate isomerase [bacterium]